MRLRWPKVEQTGCQPSRHLLTLAHRTLILVSCVTSALAAQQARADIASARYVDPTTRYTHGVLGDAIEWGALELRLKSNKRLRLVLPQDRVFEDIAPRLVDMDGDGAPEVLVVESSQNGGARLAIYKEDGLVTATPYIGQRNRWLAPVGAADLDGDGHIEVAYIDRPHLAKILRVWRFKNGSLREVGSIGNLTNHKIGQDFISGGLRDCGQQVEMITVDGSWNSIVSTTFDGKKLNNRILGPFDPKALERALKCE